MWPFNVVLRTVVSVTTIVALSSLNAYAFKVRNCEGVEVEYIKQLHQKSAFIEDNASDRVFGKEALSTAETCQLQSKIISDGLGFTLYRLNGESTNYILLHNAFDGSSQLYGPFAAALSYIVQVTNKKKTESFNKVFTVYRGLRLDINEL